MEPRTQTLSSQEKCPKCGGEDIASVQSDESLDVTCYDCGHQWSEANQEMQRIDDELGRGG